MPTPLRRVRSPDDVVVRDSQGSLWGAVREGLVVSADLTPLGELRPSLTPTPEESMVLTPYQRQERPFVSSAKPRATTTSTNLPTSRPPRHPLERIDANVQILKNELKGDDNRHAQIDEAIDKISQGLHELVLAVQCNK